MKTFSCTTTVQFLNPFISGHEAIETVYLMNNEEEPFHFAFEEDSCHSAGYSAHLKVHPMNGVLPPKSR